MKLSKMTQQSIAMLVDAVKTEQTKVADALAEFNAAMAGRRDSFAAVVTAYNASLEDLKGTLEAAKDEQQEEFDGKSERWQEGDRGQAAEEWITALESACDSLDPIAVALPEEVEAPDFPDLDDIEALPSQPEA